MKTTFCSAKTGTDKFCAGNDTLYPKGMVDRHELLDNLTALRDQYGLSTGHLNVIRAMLSYLPSPDKSNPALISANSHTTCFASNKSIATRALQNSESTIRRAISTLVSLGFVNRNESSNRKRFPVYEKGKIVAAYGIDLAPLLSRWGEIKEALETNRIQKERIRSLKTQLRTIRQEFLEMVNGKHHRLNEWVEDLGRKLRNNWSIEALQAAYDRINTALAKADLLDAEKPTENADDREASPAVKDNSKAVQMTASASQNERHIESEKIREIKREQNPLLAYRSSKHIKAFFPDEPRSVSELQEMIFQIGTFLNLKRLPDAISILGWYHCTRALDYICGKACNLNSPEAYLSTLVTKAKNEKRLLGEIV